MDNVTNLNNYRRDKHEEKLYSLKRRADDLTVAGDWLGAIKVFQEMLTYDPTCEQTLMSIGGVLSSHVHDYEGALEYFKRALKLDTKSASAAFVVGLTYGRIGELDRAEAALKLAKINGHARAEEELEKLKGDA